MDETKRQEIVGLLRKAFNMELETVCNYTAQSINLDGFRAKHIKDALAADITEELGHAQRLAHRIKVLEGVVPGSMELTMNQKGMQPNGNALDILSVINGVIEAEEAAVNHYQKLIDACDGADPVTEDLCIQLKGDEEEHRRLFKGFLNEVESGVLG